MLDVCAHCCNKSSIRDNDGGDVHNGVKKVQNTPK